MVQWASGSGLNVTVGILCGARDVQADIAVRDKDPHDYPEMGRDIDERHSFSEVSSKEVGTVNIGDSSDSAISHDPDTLTYDSSEATHAFDEGVLRHLEHIHAQPCVHARISS